MQLERTLQKQCRADREGDRGGDFRDDQPATQRMADRRWRPLVPGPETIRNLNAEELRTGTMPNTSVVATATAQANAIAAGSIATVASRGTSPPAAGDTPRTLKSRRRPAPR